MNDRVYLHEVIDIVGQNRAKYNEHMCNYRPLASKERRMEMVGNFSTVGSTERWPESINLWEFVDGWDGVARNFRHEFNNPVHQDKNLVPWWAEALNYRSGGYDRLLVASPQSPTVDQLHSNGVTGECYMHELIQVRPGSARDYLSMIDEVGRTVFERYRWTLVGAYRHAMVNDSEVVVLWAVPTWDAWASWEKTKESDENMVAWRRSTASVVVDWRAKLLAASADSPLGNSAPVN